MIDKYNQCDGCAYKHDKSKKNDIGCIAFTSRPRKCWNYTTMVERSRRERQIMRYAQVHDEGAAGNE